jgi:hypothetical protein
LAYYSSWRRIRSEEGPPSLTDLHGAYKKIDSPIPPEHLAKLERKQGVFLPLEELETLMEGET